MARLAAAHHRALLQDAATARRHGRRSIMLAGLGLLAVTVLAVVASQMSSGVTAHGGMAGAFFVARLLHVAGALIAVSGLLHSLRAPSAVLGLAINLALLMAGDGVADGIAGRLA
jgi:hypothetical protein